jgi:membrane protein DedA with SNARE-associated domain
MRINLRQEIAMWVLGLLWTGLSVIGLIDAREVSGVLQVAAVLLVLLVPIFLIVFSLRDRKKRNNSTAW